MKTPQEVRDEFIEEFYQHMLKSTPVLTSFERASLKLKLQSLLTSYEEKIMERVKSDIAKEKEKLVTMNCYGNCNPRCHDSGADSAFTHIEEFLQTLRSKNE